MPRFRCHRKWGEHLQEAGDGREPPSWFGPRSTTMPAPARRTRDPDAPHAAPRSRRAHATPATSGLNFRTGGSWLDLRERARWPRRGRRSRSLGEPVRHARRTRPRGGAPPAKLKPSLRRQQAGRKRLDRGPTPFISYVVGQKQPCWDINHVPAIRPGASYAGVSCVQPLL
jgi:hypothetical protein